MLKFIVALLSGVIFGLGLIVAGMSNPVKVLAFLDLAGQWNPSLALVMVSGIAVMIGGFKWAAKMPSSLLGLPFHLPNAKDIDLKLVFGSAIFGLGWGLVGICPGPAVVLLGAGLQSGIVFFVAMLAGMALFQIGTHYLVGRKKI